MSRIPYLKFLIYGFLGAVGIVLFRDIYQDKEYIFLLWNILLACIPLCLTYIISRSLKHSYIVYSLFVLWFLFLPNAPYVITDFIHLHHGTSTIFWIDLIMFFYAAVFSLVVGVIGLEEGRRLFVEKTSKDFLGTVLVIVSILLSGFGVYLGRFPRFNSWHVLTRPGELITGVFEHGVTVATQKGSFVFVCLFSFIFGMSYWLYKVLIKDKLV